MIEQTQELLVRLRTWGEAREDVRALLLVGSVARDNVRPDSDIDIILMTTHPAAYLESVDWVAEFGAVRQVALEHYGKVTSVRTHYGNGLEVEFTIAGADWASTPLDSGTAEVARNGIVVLLDRDGHATDLADGCKSKDPVG